MPKYVCTKCHAEAWSKNIATRNLFLDDQKAALLTNVFAVKSKRGDGCWEVTISAKIYDRGDGVLLEPDEAEMAIASWIAQTTEQERKTWLCNHHWHTDDEPEC